MTPKERARLRGLANGIDTVLQIGKDGIGDTLIHQADITLEARELIKGRVLDTCMDYTPRTAAEALALATNSEVVQVIGSKFVLYRKRNEAPKKAPPTGNQARKKAAPTGNQARKGKPSGNRPRKAELSVARFRNSRDGDAHGVRKPRDAVRNPRNDDASGQRKPRDAVRNPRNADASGQRKPHSDTRSHRKTRK